jgi:hypothetical protein
LVQSRRGCLCGGVGTRGAPRSTWGQPGRKRENPLSSMLNGRNAWLEGAPLTQQRKRKEEMGPYRKSRLRGVCLLAPYNAGPRVSV